MENPFVMSNVEGQFNQALQQQIRIHEILSRINSLNVNPLMYNSELGDYNYNIIIRDLDSLVVTPNPKLKQVEIELIDKYRKLIQDCLKYKPIHERKINESLKDKISVRINHDNWNYLYELIFKYRCEVERLMDVHGYGNPNKKDPSKAILDMG